MSRSTHVAATVTLVTERNADTESDFMRVAEAFHALPEDAPRDLEIDLERRELTFSYTFGGVLKPDAAVARALALGRAALDAPGLGTPGPRWELATWRIGPSGPRGRTFRPAPNA